MGTRSAGSGRRKRDAAVERTAVSEERRDEIINAAIRVFNRDGFRGATLEDVAAEVGISKSLIYYHFKNKFEILAQMYRNMGELFFQVLVPILENPELDYVERLRLTIRAHVTIAIDNKSIFEIYFRERHEIPRDVQEKLVNNEDRGYVKRLTKLLEDGEKDGAFDPGNARVAAFSIIGACNWITFWYRKNYDVRGSQKGLNAQDVADTIFHTVASGLVVRNGATSSKSRKN